MTDDRRARERRAAARRHHPDLGGDPAAFDRAMKSFELGQSSRATESAEGTRRPDVGPVPLTRASRAAKAVRATGKTLVADVRRRLPRSFPGSRRYGHL